MQILLKICHLESRTSSQSQDSLLSERVSFWETIFYKIERKNDDEDDEPNQAASDEQRDEAFGSFFYHTGISFLVSQQLTRLGNWL